MHAPTPTNEAERLAELTSFDILDTLPEEAYEDITFLASRICETPIALLSLVDENRQWFKSRVGIEMDETARDVAFCAHAILEPARIFEIRDTHADSRFRQNPLVTGDPGIRFYAGAPLVASNGTALGALCVIDRRPRRLTEEQRRSLLALSRQVMAHLELRRAIRQIAEAAEQRLEYAKILEEYQLKLEAANEDLARQSVTDALTGLANRREVDRVLAAEWDRGTRYGIDLSVVLIDLDGFKAYNDDLGHQAGDEALAAVGRVIESMRRRSDVAGRYGGEEFILILPETPAAGAYVLSERIRRAIEATVLPRRITASLGVAERRGSTTDIAELVSAADAALYRAKLSGRNRVVLAGAFPTDRRDAAPQVPVVPDPVRARALGKTLGAGGTAG